MRTTVTAIVTNGKTGIIKMITGMIATIATAAINGMAAIQIVINMTNVMIVSHAIIIPEDHRGMIAMA
jgi:hypothetical protein